MSWFNMFSGDVIFGGLRVCDAVLDWRFDCNIGFASDTNGLCYSFPESTCTFGPSQVFSAFYCTTQTGFDLGCAGHEQYYMDYKFRQLFMDPNQSVNVSIVASFGCQQVTMEHNATGLSVNVLDDYSNPACLGSSNTTSTSSLSLPYANTTTSAPTYATSTVLVTNTYTITSCPPTVTNCPIGEVTTEIVSLYTTFWPDANTTTTTSTPTTTTTTSSLSEDPKTTTTTSSLSEDPTTTTTTSSPSEDPTTTTITSSPSEDPTTTTITSSPTFTTSTVFVTNVYTVTSCHPTVTDCPMGQVTTETISMETTYCPDETTTSSPSATSTTTTGSASSVSAMSPAMVSTGPSGGVPAQVSVNAGSSKRVPWFLVVATSLLVVLFSVPGVLSSVDFGSGGSRYGRKARNLGTMEVPDLSKRVVVNDAMDIKNFRETLVSKVESHLPTTGGESQSLLETTALAVTRAACEKGQSNLATYGPTWASIPGLKLLGHMLADCVTSMDQMDKVLLSYYSQADIDKDPQALLFLKFAGIMYCNRIMAPLVVDSTSLSTVCSLTS